MFSAWQYPNNVSRKVYISGQTHPGVVCASSSRNGLIPIGTFDRPQFTAVLYHTIPSQPTQDNMRWGALITVLASLAAPALSYSINRLPKRDSGLEVVLSSVGNTEVKAVVTNKGESKVSLLNFNSVLDSAPVHKVSIQKNGMFH